MGTLSNQGSARDPFKQYTLLLFPWMTSRKRREDLIVEDITYFGQRTCKNMSGPDLEASW